jgi:ABC-type Mn2+/Zn2+ transport system permease subunit
VIAVGSGVIGLYLSYYADYSSGASIVLTATACFMIAWLYRALRTA